MDATCWGKSSWCGFVTALVLVAACQIPDTRFQATGACSNTASDPDNCGVCGRRCADLAGVSSGRVSCTAGHCDLASACQPARADCDQSEDTGCEASLSSAATCGRCDNACQGSAALCASAGDTWHCVSACSDPEVACGSSCANLASDPHHCGRCGHDCDGGSCMQGVCQAVTVYDQPDLPASRLAVTRDGLYWTSADKIASCPLPDGCRLAPRVLVENIARLGALMVSGTDVYFAGCTQSCNIAVHFIYKCPVAGCPAVPSSIDSTGNGLFTGILAAPTHVYWWGATIGVRQGGQEFPPTDFGDSRLGGVVLGDDLYVRPSIPGDMYVCPQPAGCGARAVLTGSSIVASPYQAFRDQMYWFAVDPSNTTRRLLRACDPASCSSSETRLGEDVVDVAEVAVDDSGVYWLNTSGEIRHCPLAGCQGAPDRLVLAGIGRSGVTLGAASVFWVEGGIIRKVAKP